MAASSYSAELGPSTNLIASSASYIKGCIDSKAVVVILKDKPRLIVSAALEAQRACECVKWLQPLMVSA